LPASSGELRSIREVEIINQNIYEEATLEKYKNQFDLILLKDVIEHIPDQERFIPYLKKFQTRWDGLFRFLLVHAVRRHQQVCKANSSFPLVSPAARTHLQGS
jgi:2-polyprenyl-3-methyl-5-hydroxy-6-metoxy-1,4-benzoquinol methylase